MIITRIWKDQPGRFFCVSSKSQGGRWHDEFFDSTHPRFQWRVREYVEANRDKDLYFCPHGFSKKRRLKDYAELPALLWADLDEADPSSMTPMPSIAWCSSPGRYVGLWRLTDTMSESLNRRLTYLVGADPGGWDITQVLRIPGTYNYKYPHTPRVKMLWQDGPEYEPAEIERLLPEEKEAPPSFGDAHEIFKRYEQSLSPFARREILKGKVQKGKRSEVIWRLNQELLEAGMTVEEAFALLRVSPWNKFANRREGDAQLRREIEKALQHKLESVPTKHREDAQEAQYLRPMSEVEEENIDWIWYPFVARREMTILEGDPGLGKSYLAQIIGLHLCDGKRLPVVQARKVVQGRVAYFDMENSAGSVTKRRLTDNGCQHLENYYQEERPFSIDDEESLELMYTALERIRPVLVVFDTINVYVGKADTHKASESAQALAQFVDIAKRFDCAVIVLRHLTKSGKDRALYRGQGSIGFTGTARVVITVGVHPEDEEKRVASVTKLNVTRRPQALTFTIESLPDTLKHADRSRFVWGEFVDLTSDEILAAVPIKKTPTKELVQDFLDTVLAAGPMKKSDLLRAAEARGFSAKTVMEVSREIGIVKESKGFGSERCAWWSLPATQGPSDRSTPNRSESPPE